VVEVLFDRSRQSAVSLIWIPAFAGMSGVKGKLIQPFFFGASPICG